MQIILAAEEALSVFCSLCASRGCRLLRALLPGPVTVVLRRRSDAPLAADLNPGVETIGAHRNLAPR